MPKPLADRREIDARLEQVDRRGMSQRVRVDALLVQGACRGGTGHDVLVEQIANAKTRELAAAPVCEQQRVDRRASRYLLRQLPQSSGGRGPDWAEPHLAAFATQSDLARWLGPNVAQLEV
jgi:hypothetical protein